MCPIAVYGTLRAGERNDALLAGRLARRERGRLAGAVLVDSGHDFPYALVTDRDEDAIIVDVVWPHPDDAAGVLADLDALEGFRCPGDPANHYDRVRRPVALESGTIERCWVYVAGPAVRRRLDAAPRIAGGDWLAR